MAENPDHATVDPLSLTSLYLKLYVRDQHLSNASGFVVRYAERNFLVTNWHVLSGRHADTQKPLSPTAGIPDQLRIAHLLTDAGSSGFAWQFRREALQDGNGKATWFEHPKSNLVDVACVELTDVPDNVRLMPLGLNWPM